MEVDYLNQKYDLTLAESEFYETLGGLIAYTIEEIPEKGEKIELPPYLLEIKKVSAKKIEQIILTKLEND